MVLALVEEFFSGLGAGAEAVAASGLPARSVFAVGDTKQSIYSFQGADPSRFEMVRNFLETRATGAAPAGIPGGAAGNQPTDGGSGPVQSGGGGFGGGFAPLDPNTEVDRRRQEDIQEGQP